MSTIRVILKVPCHFIIIQCYGSDTFPQIHSILEFHCWIESEHTKKILKLKSPIFLYQYISRELKVTNFSSIQHS